MEVDEIWDRVKEWLAKQRTIGLTRGMDFRARFEISTNSIIVVPTETGIPRRITKDEWKRFGDKFNEVEESAYDQFRPGHYAQITHNSSYLVAILKGFGYSE